jgi:bifunctional UDP-N-acetylglucosamine pyrophosphorylase/glucosamine-1-phosphate N-acetyltransferase
MAATPLAGIILAAGKGTRMKSRLPKVLHEVCGLPMLEWAIRAFEGAGIDKPVAVLGHGGSEIVERLGDRIEIAWQHEQLGTGHAALMAREALSEHCGPVLIAPGDAPGIRAESLQKLAQLHRESGATVTLATVRLPDPTCYGRILRDDLGEVVRIVEEKDADAETKKIDEVGVSVYCVDSDWAFDALPRLSNSNAQGEYYLTELVVVARQEGKGVRAHTFADAEEFAGVNDRWQLTELEARMRKLLLKKHALNGVTIRNVEDTFIGPDVVIGNDVILEAGCTLTGGTVIGEDTHLGPQVWVEDSEVEVGCRISYSVVRGARIGARVKVGPFAHIRPGSVLHEDCRIGNFVEVKNSVLGPAVSASHLTYLGDASIGERTNVGAGVVLANYDGVRKHRTDVGSNVFLGSNSTVIAPITIGDNAIVTAGSVVTMDVPANAGAFGRARTEIKEGWGATWRLKTGQQSKEANPNNVQKKG